VTGPAGSGDGVADAVAAGLAGSGFRVERIVEPGPRAVEVAVARRAAAGGPVAVLVTTSAAPAELRFGTLADAGWMALLDSALGGVTGACRAVLPGMIAAGRGTIVICVPAAAHDPRSGNAYAAAAAGTLLGFAKSLGVEVAPAGVRVNCLLVDDPGPAVETIAFLVHDGDFYVSQVFAPRSA